MPEWCRSQLFAWLALVAALSVAGTARASSSDQPSARVPVVVFWGIGCPHCEHAQPFIAALEKRQDLSVERVEVRRNPPGRERFRAEMQRLGVEAPGIPAFVVGDEVVLGYSGESTERKVGALIARAHGAATTPELEAIELPLIGSFNPQSVSLPALTLLIGLLDGINPCAMWVLLVLLGILIHVRSRFRLALFGGVFVLASGIVYFAFMTAWVNVFALMGISRAVSFGLGAVVLVMGLINLKELFWFKRGVSLMIPQRAKPGLMRRMRKIPAAASLPAALLGVTALAFVVNLIELGCTLGLPAVYTRILTLRPELSATGRYAYLALYNLAYVVPLALIVIAYAATLHRLTLSERGAKALKGVSGALLTLFGVVLMLAPQLLA